MRGLGGIVKSATHEHSTVSASGIRRPIWVVRRSHYQPSGWLARVCLAVIVATLTVVPLVGVATVAAQVSTPTPTPTRTATPPPTATPFPCNTGSSAGMTWTYADLHRWNGEILSVHQSTGVPANVIKAIMWVESRGMLNARSPLTSSGYYFGLMQIGATSAVPDYMKSVVWMCDNAYNQVLAGGTELVNKSRAINSTDWTRVAGAYFGYGTDVTGTNTNTYMQMFVTHATALIGTTPGGTDWTPAPLPTPTPAPTVTFAIGSVITVDTDTLNMRSSPGLSTTILRVLLKGTSGTVLAGPNRVDNYDWYQIRLADGATGWVAGQMMRGGGAVGSPTTGTPTSTPTRTPTRTPTGGAGSPTATAPTGGNAGGGFAVGDGFRVDQLINFRSAPGYAGPILRSYGVGATGVIIGVGQTVDGLHWSNVRMSDNATGWMASQFLTKTTSAATATPTQTPTSTASPTRTPTTAPTVSPASGTSTAGFVYRTTTSVNLRQAPSTTATILGTLPTGSLVTMLGSSTSADGHTWARVQAGVLTGWISTRYISPTGSRVATPTGVATVSPTPSRTPTAGPSVPPASGTSSAGFVYRTTTSVNVRQSPSTSATIIGTLPSGSMVVLLGDSAQANGHTWVRVQAGTITGWMALQYLSATGSRVATPTGVASITPTPSRTPTSTATPTRTSTPNGTATRAAGGFISGDTVRVDSGPLNYRSGAGTTSSIIGTLPLGTTALILNGPVEANSMSWYQLQVTGQPNGWVAGQYLTLVAPSVVNGSVGGEDVVESTLRLEPTATATPTSAGPGSTAPGATVPAEPAPSEPAQEPTGEPSATETPLLPTETAESPTETPVPPTETPAPPTETAVPPTETPVPPTETPVPPPDADLDGIEDALDSCPTVPNTGADSDLDGLDDACDPTPFGEPTQTPVLPRTFEVYAAADTSVSSLDPAAVQPGDQVGSLPIGGETGGVAYITFYPDQIGYGQVQSAVLYLTGVSGSGSVGIAVANGVGIDEYSLTLASAPGGAGASGAWIDAGIAVPIDLTGWIAADGPVTVIVTGDGVALGSREGGSPAVLSITVLDPQ